MFEYLDDETLSDYLSAALRELRSTHTLEAEHRALLLIAEYKRRHGRGKK